MEKLASVGSVQSSGGIVQNLTSEVLSQSEPQKSSSSEISRYSDAAILSTHWAGVLEAVSSRMLVDLPGRFATLQKLFREDDPLRFLDTVLRTRLCLTVPVLVPGQVLKTTSRGIEVMQGSATPGKEVLRKRAKST